MKRWPGAVNQVWNQTWAVIALMSLLLALCSPGRAADPELLEPDKAFRFSASAIAPDLIEVRYRIAPGYYLYRDKFQFSASAAGLQATRLRCQPNF